jgi:multicomponent Na+:H+ antiporter subunit G
MAWVRDGAIVALLTVGVGLMLIAAIGLWRMPDVYSRMHVNTKAATLGILGILLALLIDESSYAVGTRVVLIMLFFLLTAPVGAHMIARATYLAGTPRAARTLRDDLRGRYDHEHGQLAGVEASADGER